MSNKQPNPQENNLSRLAWVAIVAAPAAPAYHFGHAAFQHASSQSPNQFWLPLIVGLASAIALEAVGVLSSKHAIRFAQQKAVIPTIVAVTLVVIYVVIGFRELPAGIGRTMFIIAALCYIAAGLETVGVGNPVSDLLQQIAELTKRAESAEKWRTQNQAAVESAQTLSAENKRLRTENSSLLSENTKLTKASTTQLAENTRLFDANKNLTIENKRLSAQVETYQWLDKAPPSLVAITHDYATHQQLNGSKQQFGISDTDERNIGRIAAKRARGEAG